MRIDNWLDVLFWAFFAAVALFILGTFLQILWQSFNIFSDRKTPRRAARSSFGGLGGETADTSLMHTSSETGSDSATEIAGDAGGGDSGGGGDFSGGGGDYGGGGSGGSWS